MSGDAADEALEAGVSAILRTAIGRLDAADARDEVIARYRPAGRIALIRRAPVLLPVTRAWRLGMLLLDRDGHLYETGEVTRAIETKWPSNRSLEVERRREVQAAAFRGPFAPGEVVNVDAEPIALDAASLRAGSGPLSVGSGGGGGEVVLVRWAGPGSGARSELGAYLADRVSLLTLD